MDFFSHCESSLRITTTFSTPEGDLYISVSLPSLEVGTIRGDTRLPRQKKLLELLSYEGDGDPPRSNALKFAEILSSENLAENHPSSLPLPQVTLEKLTKNREEKKK